MKAIFLTGLVTSLPPPEHKLNFQTFPAKDPASKLALPLRPPLATAQAVEKHRAREHQGAASNAAC